MTRRYTLPDPLPDEDNWAWCQRAAASIPAEELMREIVQQLDRSRSRDALDVTVMVIAHATGYRLSVAMAIAERFREKEGGATC